MANKILVSGFSGTGKTYSLRTLDPKETFIICPDEKAPPFRGWRKNYISKDPSTGNFNPATCNFLKTTDWPKINQIMKLIGATRPDIKIIVLDTITYAMIGEFMRKASVKGYDKFTQMGSNVYETLKTIDTLRDDLTVIVMAHTEVETFNGVDRTVFGVPGGKLVKDVVKPIGMFYISLETVVEKDGDKISYGFMTQNNTTNMAKSPQGMFPSDIIPNDMKVALDYIKKYEEG